VLARHKKSQGNKPQQTVPGRSLVASRSLLTPPLSVRVFSRLCFYESFIHSPFLSCSFHPYHRHRQLAVSQRGKKRNNDTLVVAPRHPPPRLTPAIRPTSTSLIKPQPWPARPSQMPLRRRRCNQRCTAAAPAAASSAAGGTRAAGTSAALTSARGRKERTPAASERRPLKRVYSGHSREWKEAELTYLIGFFPYHSLVKDPFA
jgi:hypothetical protein